MSAVLLIAVLHEPLLVLFRALMSQRDPFAAAPRLCVRALAAGASHDGEWRRYDTERGFAELGAFDGRRPRKITIVARFGSRADAEAFIGELAEIEPRIPRHSTPYRGSILINRKLIGVELDVSETHGEWRAAVTLVADGARTIVPN